MCVFWGQKINIYDLHVYYGLLPEVYTRDWQYWLLQGDKLSGQGQRVGETFQGKPYCTFLILNL